MVYAPQVSTISRGRRKNEFQGEIHRIQKQICFVLT